MKANSKRKAKPAKTTKRVKRKLAKALTPKQYETKLAKARAKLSRKTGALIAEAKKLNEPLQNLELFAFHHSLTEQKRWLEQQPLTKREAERKIIRETRASVAAVQRPDVKRSKPLERFDGALGDFRRAIFDSTSLLPALKMGGER